ncbi:MAG: hypothetical protein WCT10_05885 [Patescibacteria group bacterium]|jgi:hypothetical protein
MSAPKPVKNSRYLKPVLAGLVLAGLEASVLAFGYLTRGVTGSVDLALLAALPAAVGIVAVIILAARWRIWFWFLVFGAAIGSLSALELFLGEPFEQAFFVSALTQLYFFALSLILGAAAEFIGLLHHLFHGGDLWKYPGSD